MNSIYKFVFVLIGSVVISAIFMTDVKAGGFINYDGPKDEIAAYEVMQKYGYEQAKNNNLVLHNIAPILNAKHFTLYSIWFISHQQDSLERGRALAGKLIDSFYQTLSKDPATLEHLKNHKKGGSREGLELLDVTAMRIAYWDENVDRPKEPALAEIRFYDRRMHYYVAYPKTQVLQLVYEESFDDAVAFAKSGQKGDD